MNRILFERSEIKDGFVTFGGERAEHVMNVLHGEVGQSLKTGEIDGLIGNGEIVSIYHEAAGPSHPLVTVRITHENESLKPWVDLILAPPRPRVLKRLLPQLATMGVGRIYLVGAKKVEKDFWGATLLKEENYRPLLIDGLMQAGTSILPTIELRRNFRAFVADELDAICANRRKLVAHPYGELKMENGKWKMKEHSQFSLAIGPEGGWTDEEVALLEAHGFERYSLGARILRTDTATIAILAQLMQNDSAQL